MKRILITGANSYVGTNVERWLMKEPEKYQVDTLDMTKPSWKDHSFSNYDVVFHVAGIAHVNAKKNMEALYYEVNTDLAIETAKHAKQHGAKQFIFMSSMIVYGESKSLKPVVITKDTDTNPNGFYGDSKLQAEIGIKKLEDEQFKIVILRPPMIYGPESKGNFSKLISLAKKTPIFPAYHNQRSILYIDNLCEFVRLVIVNNDKGVFWPQNKEYFSTVKLIQLIAKISGKKIYLAKNISCLVAFFSLFSKRICKIFGSQYYEQSLSIYKTEYQICDFEKSLQRL